jgi:hypothetical protein
MVRGGSEAHRAKAGPVRDLLIAPPDPREHGEAVCDLGAKAFSGGGYFRMRDYCRKGYVLGSHYDWSASRIGLLDGRLVTHFGVWGYQMRIGTARVRAGGIGMVATDGDCRQRGLMAATARASVEAMRRLGYDLSILFGIDDFYHRFGYVRAWGETAWTVRREDLPAGGPKVRLRKFRPVHRDDIAAIYNRENATQTGTAVRPTYPRLVYGDAQEGYLWTDGRGRPVGCVGVGVKPGFLECVDACGDAEQVLRVLARLAARAERQEIQFSMFSDTRPLIRRVREGNCRAETRYRRCGGSMVATINLVSTLAKMAPELQRRLAASHLARWRGNLLVADAREEAVLRIDRSRVKVGEAGKAEHAIRGGDRIAQLLIGADDPGAIIEAAAMKTAGEARRLAEVLFPNEHPQLNLRDRF